VENFFLANCFKKWPNGSPGLEVFFDKKNILTSIRSCELSARKAQTKGFFYP
jgi:hypothetical protein